jgi:hypothetical protein
MQEFLSDEEHLVAADVGTEVFFFEEILFPIAGVSPVRVEDDFVSQDHEGVLRFLIEGIQSWILTGSKIYLCNDPLEIPLDLGLLRLKALPDLSAKGYKVEEKWRSEAEKFGPIVQVLHG